MTSRYRAINNSGNWTVESDDEGALVHFGAGGYAGALAASVARALDSAFAAGLAYTKGRSPGPIRCRYDCGRCRERCQLPELNDHVVHRCQTCLQQELASVGPYREVDGQPIGASTDHGLQRCLDDMRKAGDR